MLPDRLPFLHVGLLILLFICGCGGISTEPVTGVVTLDGQPLEGARVVFAPAEGGRANSAGTTNPEGAYSLNYTRQNVGAIVGSYKVLFSKTVQTDRGEIETLPAIYNQETTFTAEVTSTGDNKFNYDLTSQ